MNIFWALLVGLLIVIMAYVVLTAPDGEEDETEFHFGKKKEDSDGL